MARRSREEEYYEDEEEPRSRRSRSRYEDDDRDDEPRSRRSRRSRRDEEDDDEPRSRRRRSRRDERDEDEDEEPRSRRRRSRRDEEDEDDEPRSRRRSRRDEDEDDDDDEEPRSRGRRSRRDEEDDDDDDEPRSRRKSSRESKGSRKSADGPIKSGWGAAEDNAVSDDYARSLKLEDGKEVVIRFLEDVPYASYARHWVESGEGRQRSNRPYTCLGSVDKECPLCEEGVRNQKVSAFNVAVIDQDGGVSHRSFDVGIRLYRTIKSFAEDPKTSPLSKKRFYVVKRTGSGRNTQTTIIPISEAVLEEDYEVLAPTPEEYDELELYTSDIVEVPELREMEDLADALAGEDYR